MMFGHEHKMKLYEEIKSLRDRCEQAERERDDARELFVQVKREHLECSEKLDQLREAVTVLRINLQRCFDKLTVDLDEQYWLQTEEDAAAALAETESLNL